MEFIPKLHPPVTGVPSGLRPFQPSKAQPGSKILTFLFLFFLFCCGCFSFCFCFYSKFTILFITVLQKQAIPLPHWSKPLLLGPLCHPVLSPKHYLLHQTKIVYRFIVFRTIIKCEKKDLGHLYKMEPLNPAP